MTPPLRLTCPKTHRTAKTPALAMLWLAPTSHAGSAGVAQSEGELGPGRPADRLTPAASSPPVSRVPDWVLEKNITGPVGVHAGGCWVPADNSEPLTRDQARQAIAEGAAECPACHAHTTLDTPN